MANNLTDEDVARLKVLLNSEGLEAFLPFADQAAAEAKLTAARRLLVRAYWRMFVAFVGVIITVATFWEKTTGFLRVVIVGTGGD